MPILLYVLNNIFEHFSDIYCDFMLQQNWANISGAQKSSKTQRFFK